jgi:hypothetical protein
MRRPFYRSDIPRDAKPVITLRYAIGRARIVEYRLAGQLVGVREFHETGELERESACRDDRLHGMQYEWSAPGRLLSAEPYADDLPHGTAYVWYIDGSLLGSYEMDRGTGVDLWWTWCTDTTSGVPVPGPPWLSEVHYLVDGSSHGCEWWLRPDHSLWEERHWQHGALHGIEREWGTESRLRRGFPRYFLHGQQVTRRVYLRAQRAEPTLPAFRPEDNLPRRSFPPVVQAALKRPFTESPDGTVVWLEAESGRP